MATEMLSLTDLELKVITFFQRKENTLLTSQYTNSAVVKWCFLQTERLL